MFNEAEHPRDARGRFTKKGKSIRKQALHTLRKRLVRIDLQFFTEKAILTQTNQELIDGIESLKNVKEYHEYKIAHPWEFYKDWYQVPEKVQQGRLYRWYKEIKNHINGINDRIAELKKRGIDYEKK